MKLLVIYNLSRKDRKWTFRKIVPKLDQPADVREIGKSVKNVLQFIDLQKLNRKSIETKLQQLILTKMAMIIGGWAESSLPKTLTAPINILKEEAAIYSLLIWQKYNHNYIMLW